MENKLFDELLASVKEGGEILKGERAPSRRFDIEPLGIRRIRENLNITQQNFAALIGISVATLRNWEQGRRSPEGPALILLHIAARHPQTVKEVVESLGTTL